MQKKTQLLKWAVPLLTLLVVGVASFSTEPFVTKADSGGSCQLMWGSGTTQLDTSQVEQSVRDALQGANLTNCTQQFTSCKLVKGPGDTTLNFDNIRATSPDLVSNLKDYNLNCGSSTKGSSSSSISSSGDDPRRCNNSKNKINGSISIDDEEDGGINNSSSGLDDSDCNSNTPPPSPGSCQLAWIDGGGGSTELNADRVTDQGLKDTLKGTGTALPPGYNLKCADDVKASSCKLVPGDNDSGDTELDLANVQNRSPWLYEKLLNKYGLNCDIDDDDIPNKRKKVNKSKNPVSVKDPQFTKACGSDESRDEGNYYSMRIGRVPRCNTVRWTFDSAVVKGKTCTFSTSWYGGHSWVMNVFTSDNPNRRAYAFLINGSAFTRQLRDVSRIEVGMGKDARYGASADLKNQDLHVGAITASNCKV